MEDATKRVNNKDLMDRFEDFIETYEGDMRGDKNLNICLSKIYDGE